MPIPVPAHCLGGEGTSSHDGTPVVRKRLYKKRASFSASSSQVDARCAPAWSSCSRASLTTADVDVPQAQSIALRATLDSGCMTICCRHTSSDAVQGVPGHASEVHVHDCRDITDATPCTPSSLPALLSSSLSRPASGSQRTTYAQFAQLLAPSPPLAVQSAALSGLQPLTATAASPPEGRVSEPMHWGGRRAHTPLQQLLGKRRRLRCAGRSCSALIRPDLTAGLCPLPDRDKPRTPSAHSTPKLTSTGTHGSRHTHAEVSCSWERVAVIQYVVDMQAS